MYFKKSLIAAIVTAAFGMRGVVMLLTVAALTLFLGLFFRRRIGGITGDIMGAVCEINEVSVLMLMCAFFMR